VSLEDFETWFKTETLTGKVSDPNKVFARSAFADLIKSKLSFGRIDSRIMAALTIASPPSVVVRSLPRKAGRIPVRDIMQRMVGAVPPQHQERGTRQWMNGSDEEGMLTMAVADLAVGGGTNVEGASLSHKVVPALPGHEIDDSIECRNEIMLNGDAQRRLDEFVYSANVVHTEAQELELQQVKTELAIRDKEIDQLRSQLAEKDARLRTARSDLMEAKAAEAEQRTKLVQVYELLAETRGERARLAQELIQTTAELSDTRRELEELADEILSMKDFVLSEEEATLFDATLNAAVQIDSELNDDTALYKSHPQNEPSFEMTEEMNDSPAWIAAAQSLVELSRQIVNDAKIDEHVFSGAGWLKGITGQFDKKK
jgi:hypothetical protein